MYQLISFSSLQVPVPGFCKQGNESSGFNQGMEFFDRMNDYRLLKKMLVVSFKRLS
jgi:hypothetical protein